MKSQRKAKLQVSYFCNVLLNIEISTYLPTTSFHILDDNTVPNKNNILGKIMHLKNISARKMLSSDLELHSRKIGLSTFAEGDKLSQKSKNAEIKKSNKKNEINSETLVLEKLLSFHRSGNNSNSIILDDVKGTCKKLISMQICGLMKSSHNDIHGHLVEIQKLSSPIYTLLDDYEFDGAAFERLLRRPRKSGKTR